MSKLSDKEKDLAKKAFLTLLFTWGSDAPAEAVWAANEFIDFFNEYFDLTIKHIDEESLENYDELIATIEGL